MRILTELDIEKLFDVDNSKSDYEKYLYFYELLESQASIFLEKIVDISLSDVLYSKYYWFLALKKESERTHGANAGLDQMAYKLIVSIYKYSGIDFDGKEYTESIKMIESLVYG